MRILFCDNVIKTIEAIKQQFETLYSPTKLVLSSRLALLQTRAYHPNQDKPVPSFFSDTRKQLNQFNQLIKFLRNLINIL